jgi:hypothetical protein
VGVDERGQQGHGAKRPKRAKGVRIPAIAVADRYDSIGFDGHPPSRNRGPVDRHDPGRAKPRHATGETGPGRCRLPAALRAG